MTGDFDSSATEGPVAPERSPPAERFLQLYAEHHERLLAHIFSLLPNEQDARDVFQKTSLVLWRKFDQFQEEADFLAWACGIAYYEVRNFLRVAGRNRLCFNDELLNTLSAERLQRRQHSDRRAQVLTECIEKLSQADRDLVHQIYATGRAVKDLADEVGRAVQTVYNRLNLIRRRLLTCVQRSLAQQGE